MEAKKFKFCYKHLIYILFVLSLLAVSYFLYITFFKKEVVVSIPPSTNKIEITTPVNTDEDINNGLSKEEKIKQVIEKRNKKIADLKIKVYEVSNLITALELDKYDSIELYYPDKNGDMSTLSTTKLFELSTNELEVLKKQINSSGVYIKNGDQFIKAEKKNKE